MPWLTLFEHLLGPARVATLDQCKEVAKSILGSSYTDIRPVSQQGSLSYTVHPLHVCRMPCKPGTAASTVSGACEAEDEAQSSKAKRMTLSGEHKRKRITYLRALGRYFARCYMHPQRAPASGTTNKDEDGDKETQDAIRRMGIIRDFAPKFSDAIAEIEAAIPILFNRSTDKGAKAYPQALAHGDLAKSNILLDETACDITGIVDWSLARIAPFGTDLGALFLSTGNDNDDEDERVGKDGNAEDTYIAGAWKYYDCRAELEDAFWGEFWAATGIVQVAEQGEVRRQAEMAGQLKTITSFCFNKLADGTMTDSIVKFNKGLVVGLFSAHK
ncbi:Uu.00g025290.m01.CDS01 [Anthostomella pinea]|uniref:Uu.00g025290.m01.CDS01 n=1 Tax=Anthostomella pinea TaxID=933095 RepID=A0AAI8V8B7_9PEZI|nr:Uu.00g025290.m01.CDS01 [Anthostomella pinea]